MYNTIASVEWSEFLGFFLFGFGSFRGNNGPGVTYLRKQTLPVLMAFFNVL